MGHERIAVLPKTEKWQKVVEHVAKFDDSEADIAEIAKETIKNVRSKFRFIQFDQGVVAAFQYLVFLSVASRSSDPYSLKLADSITLPKNLMPLELTKAVHSWVNGKKESYEYGHFAHNSAGDAIAIWYREHQTSQISFLDSFDDPLVVWRKAGDGGGFCELARLFFGKFTERYLNYFLEREASGAIPNLSTRNQFKKQLSEHVDRISQHAFETAKITQSFAAGWYNKHTKEGMPPEKEIKNFLSIAFGKIREELLREVSDK
ncbi:MAG: hypothetical protein CV087_21060 [Candidatus Brocadia sp. WS118]|nr:MAG: hypothetical protein CV087_21060 [Candidatus Brocadia sp. WS118]